MDDDDYYYNEDTLSIQETHSKTALSWFIEKLAGAKDSLSKFVTKAAISPLSWMTEEDLNNLKLTRTTDYMGYTKQGSIEYTTALSHTNKGKMLNPKAFVSYSNEAIGNLGQSLAGATGQIITASLEHTILSAGVFSLSAIAAVGMAATKATRRVTGTMALLGNMVRHGLENIEDIYESHIIKTNKKAIETEFKKTKLVHKAFKDKLNEFSQEAQLQLEEVTNRLRGSYGETDLIEASKEYNRIKQNFSGTDKKKLNELDVIGSNLIKLVQPLAKLIDKSIERSISNYTKLVARDQHDRAFAKLPGVKEMRQNVQLISEATKSTAHAITHPIETAKNIGFAVKTGKIKQSPAKNLSRGRSSSEFF